MNLFFEILTAIAILAIAASTIFYFVNIFFWPENTVLWDQEEHELRRTVIDKWLHIGPMWAAFIGIWFCIYKGVIAVNNWIPSNWIGEDLIFTIAFLVSFFGALGLVSGMSKLLNLLLKYRIEIDRLQEVLKVLETGAALSSAEPEPEAKHTARGGNSQGVWIRRRRYCLDVTRAARDRDQGSARRCVQRPEDTFWKFVDWQTSDRQRGRT